MSDLVIQPLSNGEFKLISGDVKDFETLSRWREAYKRLGQHLPDHVEMEDLVHLISEALEGPEHGVKTSYQWKQNNINLRDRLVEWGYRPVGRWTDL